MPASRAASPMRSIASRRLAVALGAAAALSACGSGSTEDYRAKAADICGDAAKSAEDIQPPTRAAQAAIADYFERLHDVSDRATDRFAKLDPPDELQDAHDDLVRANREAGKQVGTIVERVADGEDPEKVLIDAQTRVRETTAAAQKAAERLEVPECTS